ncbi:MAG: 2-hydroxyacid dehydrogenase [Candidatus Dormibacteria bacterium]
MADVLCTLALPDPFEPTVRPRASLRVLGYIPTTADLVATLHEHPVDVLCPQLRDPITPEVLDAAGARLRAVALYAVGFNNVDVAAATERGVIVTHTPGVLTDATADCTVGLLLAATRRLAEGDRAMRAGSYHGWEPTYMLGLELSGARLGIVGFGRIGQAVARRCLGFGMDVVYASDVPVAVDGDLRGRVREVSLDDLFASSDVVSLHVPLTDATRHLVDEARLRTMKGTAYIVNTSRGPVIDETALVKALQERWIAGAGLDVYETEPATAPGLTECENAVLAPHLGSATVQTRAAMARLTAENTVAALQGQVPPNALNPAAWDGRRLPPLA